MASLGELERTLMDRLWAAAGPVSATELQQQLADRGLALTTVHTVLSRLEQKGFVVHDDQRPRRFAPRATREAHAAELMHEVLGQSADRQAVLARFVGSVDAEDAAMLRALLAGGGAAGGGVADGDAAGAGADGTAAR
ncbi:hypothetical protein GCM10023328_43380 [Modestobacter marinus]|uniref:Putative transcriptional regulator n=1 Tax=Modestobacter marinus TaxID=477641 RepID=A0A846LQ54_9ACTN|nr:BlaI/MecI/CopY family transcriptional regulator [Modestobacter marinus]NIH68362.1 putative transcriptional regulator [Modestobacter marinus]GGL56662.1 hypothetical protein GCM10011589_10810 [Modestobacter marinus]